MTHTVNGFVSKAERLAYLEQLLSGKLPAGPATEHLLTRLMNPAVRGPFLETLLLQPWPTIQNSVESVAASGDERAAVILSPLLHSLEESVVLLTINALRGLGSPAARPALSERAEFDQRVAVRQAAAKALDHLPEETAPEMESAQLPLHSAYLTVVDGAGGQMALVARRWEEDEIAIFHVIFDDTQGILESFGFPTEHPLELVDTLDDLEDDGLTPAEVPLPEIRIAVDDAYQQALEQRGRVPVSFAAWQPFLAGDDPREVPSVQLPEVRLEEDFETFAECHQLLDLDEFGTWYFEPAEIGNAVDRARRLQHRRDEPDYERRLVGLIRQTLSSHVPPDRQRLFRRRLERQASLLMRIYDEPIHARRALAAAAGLAEDAGIPASEHPLLQEMLIRSLEAALGRL
jgi:hypothetical protein